MSAALRSLLFVPANQPDRFPKAIASGADAVILDLEDTVPAIEKPAARAAIRDALPKLSGAALYVRVNPVDTVHCFGDLLAVAEAGLAGVMQPKVESAGQIETVDWLLHQLERERGLPDGAIDLLPIVETAKGLAALDAIARASVRVRRLTFGAGDLCRDLGMTMTPDEAPIADARARVVLGSRLAGLEPPIDTVYFDVRNVEGFGIVARRARTLGFQGKLCIHPDQVAPANAAFSPSSDEIARAKRVIAAFEVAEAKGIASIEVEGTFVDYPIVAQARRTLALAERIAGRAQ
jgi:citrate lyase subunit beta/citryl-CoA lyase